jgi:hypothetical protein
MRTATSKLELSLVLRWLSQSDRDSMGSLKNQSGISIHLQLSV